MYCSNCGRQAAGNFCSACGASLNSSTPSDQCVQPMPGDFAALARMADVKQLVAQHAALCKRKVTGEEFLQFFDKPFVLLGGIPISPIATVGAKLYAKLGVKTGKARAERIDRPPDQVFVAALCSLAQKGQVIKELHTATDGCAIEAVLPSDVWSWEGVMTVILKRADAATEVEAQTLIKGQLFDWGKSNRALDAFFRDLRTIPVLV